MTFVVRAIEVIDELVVADESLLLVAGSDGDRLVRLSSLGRWIRELAAPGITLSDLTRELVVVMGEPQVDERTPEQEVLALVNALAAQGVLHAGNE